MKSFISARLSVMMFFQFFIWGAWYVTAPLFLGPKGFTGADFGWTYSVGPIAGMISPFLVGMIADRFFSTERILGVLHLVGGAAMLYAASLMTGETINATSINLVFFVHMLCFFPTLALTNSLALNNMTDAKKQFPLIRVFGTIGWIVAGIFLSLQGWDSKITMFYLAGYASLVMGLYCFSLPHTPPPSAGKKASAREILGLDALVLLKRPDFLVFMVCSFLICIPLAFYYQMASKFVAYAGLPNQALQMSFGQMSEIVFMLIMPLFFARLGVKWMLLVGMLAWVIRYGLFGLAAEDGVYPMILGGILLHGICYDFFFVTGQIYTDTIAPAKIRSQAQGMLVLFTLGLGMFIGAQIAGKIEGNFTYAEDSTLKAIEKGDIKEADFPHPDALAAVRKANTIGKEMKTVDAEIRILENRVTGENATFTDRATNMWRSVFPLYKSDEDRTKATELSDKLDGLRVAQSSELLTTKDWKAIWLIPSGLAGVIMILFMFLFKEGKDAPQSISEGDVAEAAAREENP